MYVRIENESGLIPRGYFEKLGVSTKRDNAETIGQFGSGSKFAPIAALRRGIEWITTAEDSAGPYTMDYVAIEEDGFDCIYFRYNGNDLRPSSYVSDAGVLSWTDDFQIFREAMSNALDEFLISGAKFTVEYVDEVAPPVSGKTAVYITATDGIREVVDNFDQYFCIHREPLSSVTFGYDDAQTVKIYKAIDPDAINVYHKGVRVHTFVLPELAEDHERDFTAIFDYDISHVTLNEERRVTYEYEVLSDIERALCKTDNVDVVETLFRSIETSFEFEHGGFQAYYHNIDSVWTDAWHNVFGDRIPVSVSDSEALASQFAIHNKKQVVVSDRAYVALRRSPIDSAHDMLGDKADYDVIEITDLDFKDALIFESAREIVASLYSGSEHCFIDLDIKVFRPKGDQRYIHGVFSPASDTIYISENTLVSGIKETIATMIHEYQHCETGIGDTSNFREPADQLIGSLMVRLFGDMIPSFDGEERGSMHNVDS